MDGGGAYANARVAFSGSPFWRGRGKQQHAFLTRRCHDFRTMASIYMSHLYTRIPRYRDATNVRAPRTKEIFLEPTAR